MLDADLALLYGYTVKRIHEQAKRNSERFPEVFMFQLTDEEVDSVWSQNATANINSKSRSNPFVYTEQETYMEQETYILATRGNRTGNLIYDDI